MPRNLDRIAGQRFAPGSPPGMHYRCSWRIPRAGVCVDPVVISLTTKSRRAGPAGIQSIDKTRIRTVRPPALAGVKVNRNAAIGRSIGRIYVVMTV
jgi:hypothetical protein